MLLWSICNGCGMPTGNAYPSGRLVPSLFLGLAYAPIVETRFPELAMSLLGLFTLNTPRYFLDCARWQHMPLGTYGQPAGTLTKLLKYKRDFCLYTPTKSDRRTLWTLYAFRVLIPHQWSLAKQYLQTSWRDGVVNKQKYKKLIAKLRYMYLQIHKVHYQWHSPISWNVKVKIHHFKVGLIE